MPTSPEMSLNCKCPKVLIVEDDEGLLGELALALQLADVSVMCANNGLSALELLRQHPQLCVVLLGWGMAGMSGKELMAAIHAEIAPQRAITRIAMSGGWTDEDQKQAQELGAVACVAKPFYLSTITEMVNMALSAATTHLQP